MNQTVLTTPQTIEGWLENLSDYMTQLELQLRTAGVDLRLLDAEAAKSLLQGLTGTLRTIVDSLRANGRQIAHEVGEYRTAKDAEHAQTRLRRLIDLHDTYLEPVIRVANVRFLCVVQRFLVHPIIPYSFAVIKMPVRRSGPPVTGKETPQEGPPACFTSVPSVEASPSEEERPAPSGRQSSNKRRCPAGVRKTWMNQKSNKMKVLNTFE